MSRISSLTKVWSECEPETSSQPFDVLSLLM